MNGFEIERKYLIRMPDPDFLSEHASPTQIEQTYLLAPSPGITSRVRKRGQEGAWHFTQTQKTRLNALRCIEDEREIEEAEYRRLLLQADPALQTIKKTRWVLPWQDQLFEIDVYPFWTDRAIMEIELADEEQPVELPPQIRVLREVTSDLRYKNYSLSRKIPMEEIEKG